MRIRKLKNNKKDLEILYNFNKKLDIYERKICKLIKKKFPKDNLKFLKNKTFNAIIAEENDKPIGYCIGILHKPHKIFCEKKHVKIEKLYVEENFRGKGIAKKLIKEMTKWGKENNAQQISLNVLYNNPAKNLYQKLGFEKFTIDMRKKI